jgi:hypothetical protein
MAVEGVEKIGGEGAMKSNMASPQLDRRLQRVPRACRRKLYWIPAQGRDGDGGSGTANLPPCGGDVGSADRGG